MGKNVKVYVMTCLSFPSL